MLLLLKQYTAKLNILKCKGDLENYFEIQGVFKFRFPEFLKFDCL